MSTQADTTFDLFQRAALSDDDLGYPIGTEFVPGDLPNVDEVVWRNLHDDRRPVVVVLGDVEMLLAPCRRSWLMQRYDGLRGQVTVRVGWRSQGTEYTVTTHVGPRPVADMRRPLPC